MALVILYLLFRAITLQLYKWFFDQVKTASTNVPRHEGSNDLVSYTSDIADPKRDSPPVFDDESDPFEDPPAAGLTRGDQTFLEVPAKRPKSSPAQREGPSDGPLNIYRGSRSPVLVSASPSTASSASDWSFNGTGLTIPDEKNSYWEIDAFNSGTRPLPDSPYARSREASGDTTGSWVQDQVDEEEEEEGYVDTVNTRIGLPRIIDFRKVTEENTSQISDKRPILSRQNANIRHDTFDGFVRNAVRKEEIESNGDSSLDSTQDSKSEFLIPEVTTKEEAEQGFESQDEQHESGSTAIATQADQATKESSIGTLIGTAGKIDCYEPRTMLHDDATLSTGMVNLEPTWKSDTVGTIEPKPLGPSSFSRQGSNLIEGVEKYKTKKAKRQSIPEAIWETLWPVVKNLETKQGYIYIFGHYSNPEIRKIGFTERRPDERLKEWNHSCRRTHSYHSTAWAYSVPHAKRVEKLIHAELQDRRRMIPCTACKTRSQLAHHREWFEGSVAELEEVIKKWVRWIQTEPYEQTPDSVWRLKEQVLLDLPKLCQPQIGVSTVHKRPDVMSTLVEQVSESSSNSTDAGPSDLRCGVPAVVAGSANTPKTVTHQIQESPQILKPESAHDRQALPAEHKKEDQGINQNHYHLRGRKILKTNTSARYRGRKLP